MSKREIPFIVVIGISIFIVIEFTLRQFLHIYPGNHTYTKWFKEVDSLKTHQGFTTDSSGIFKVDDGVAKFLSARLQSDSAMSLPKDETNKNLEVYGLDYQFNNIEKKDCILGKLIKSTPKKSVKDYLDSAIISYSKNPINEDGFRSITFKKYPSSKKKILLLGDSFTWGHNAEPIGNSFADYLLSKGFVVFNTAISGSDPEQYLATAEKYTPLLKPDFVIVNFYTGNDVQYFRRKLFPGIPIFYSTNAGNILSCPEGVTFHTAKESYDFAISRITIPYSTLFNRLCSLTSLGTLIWKFANKIGLTNEKHPEYDAIYAEQEKLKQIKPTCNDIIKEIDSLSKKNGASFFLISIPNVESGKLIRAKDIQYLFENIKYLEAPVSETDYIKSNFHYNNEGHLKHGKFIEALINKTKVIKRSF